MDFINGTWVSDPHPENIEGFLKTCGVPEPMMDCIVKRQYEVTYTVDPAAKSVKMLARVTNEDPVKEQKYELTLGEEKDCETMEGMKCKFTVTFDDAAKKYTEKCLCMGVEVTSVREIVDGKMIVTSSCKDASMKQTFTNVNQC